MTTVDPQVPSSISCLLAGLVLEIKPHAVFLLCEAGLLVSSQIVGQAIAIEPASLRAYIASAAA